MVKQNIGTSDSISPSFTPHSCSASQMGCSQRKNLSVHAIRRTEPVTHLAQQHKVSRKFVYQQLAKATAAIDQAFEPAEPKDEKVLFYLPITKTWIHQLVLSLILICHSSFRGVLDILDAMFDYHDMSLGTVHNIVQQAYWQRREQLRHTLGKLYYWIETAVIEAVSDIPRASSLLENLNSRLRNYFFLRRHISNDYLDLLRFFFNHHRYARSDRPERVGKSPAELLSGSFHGHWLELLGFERFRRN